MWRRSPQASSGGTHTTWAVAVHAVPQPKWRRRTSGDRWAMRALGTGCLSCETMSPHRRTSRE
eukprot:1483-Pyramimonas_sp.AAC.1